MTKLYLIPVLLWVLILIVPSIACAQSVSVLSTGSPANDQDYATVTAAFTAINAGTHQGRITIAINGNVTEPNTPTALVDSGVGAARYSSVIMYPTADAVTITTGTGLANNRGIIELNGADNVTIDGDNPNSPGINRNLSLAMASGVAATNLQACIRLMSGTSTVNNAANIILAVRNVAIRNLNISGVYGSTSSNGTIGIYAGSNTATFTSLFTTSTFVSDISVTNCSFRTMKRAVHFYSSATAGAGFNNIYVANNLVGTSSSTAATLGSNTGNQSPAEGFYLYYCNNLLVANNTLDLITNVTGTQYGIYTGGGTAASALNIVIRGNTISRYWANVTGTIAASIQGIVFFGDNILIADNKISNMRGVATSASTTTGVMMTTSAVFGLYQSSGAAGTKVYGNTVNMYGAPLNTSTTLCYSGAAMYSSSFANGSDIRNNIFINKMSHNSGATGATVGRFASFFLSSATTSPTNTTINNNYYGITGSSLQHFVQVAGLGSNGTTRDLANFTTNSRTWTGANASNNGSSASGAPLTFTADNNLTFASVPTEIDGLGANVNANVLGFTVDSRGVTRSSTPDLGAEEYPGSADVTAPTFGSINLANYTDGGSREVTVTISDAESKVSNFGPIAARMYYRKVGGAVWFNSLGTNTSGNSWAFILNYASLGVVAVDDQIQYFFAASDLQGNVDFLPNISFESRPTSTMISDADGVFDTSGITCTTPATPIITGDTIFCAGGSTVLTSNVPTGNFWSTGDTTRSITVTTAGNYTVRSFSGACLSLRSRVVAVSVSQLTTPTISGNTTIYAGSSTILISSALTGNLWSTGDTTASITVLTPGNYTVKKVLGDCTSEVSAATTVTLVGFAQRAGSIDSSFNTRIGANAEINTIQALPDGKILIGGNFTTYNGVNVNRLARLNCDGSLDNTFTIGTGFNNLIRVLNLQSDGKILVGGSFTNYNGNLITGLVRLNTNGSIDSSFNIGGGTNGDVYSIVIQADGRILVGGRFSSGIFRLNSDGSIDNSFNLVSGNFRSEVYKLALQPNGKILVGGYFNSYGGRSYNMIARINSDGSLDTSFQQSEPAPLAASVGQICLQNDGKILIGGDFSNYRGTNRNVFVRLNSDGSVDTGFNALFTSVWTLSSISVQSDGKILIAPIDHWDSNLPIYNGVGIPRITRLNTNGSIDSSFNVGLGPNMYVTSVALQQDGKVLIGGVFTSFNGTTANKLCRIQNDCVAPGVPTLTGTTSFCAGSSTVLTSSAETGNLWSNGDTARSIVVSTPGSYSVSAFSGICTSLVSNVINVVSNPPTYSTLARNICQGSSYVFDGIERTITGTYNDTLSNLLGCDSIITLTLTVNPLSSSTISRTICQGSSIEFGTQALTAAGTYIDTIQNSNGCDSVITLALTVNPVSASTISRTICQGSIFEFGTQTLTTAGTYIDTIQNFNGCDSVITLALTVNPVSATSISRSICQGSSFEFGGVVITTSGTYNDTLLNGLGCDSVVTLTLIVNPVSSTLINQSICQGSSYAFDGIERTITGIYNETLSNVLGCDSIIILNLTVNPVSASLISRAICIGSIFEFGTQTLTTAGTYIDTIQNANGCDSVVTLSLTVNPVSTTAISRTICQGSNFEFGGLVITTSGTYNDTLSNGLGCDSIVTLALTVNQIPVTPTISGTNSFCTGGTTTLTSSSEFGNLWSTGDTTRIITVNTAGDYSLRVVSGSCTSEVSEVTRVIEGPGSIPSVEPFGSTTICFGNSIELYMEFGSSDFINQSGGVSGWLWSNGETTSSITVREAGNYSVRFMVGNCTSEVSAPVEITVTPPFNYSVISPYNPNTVICEGDSIVLYGGSIIGRPLWSTGDTTASITVFTSGTYSYRSVSGTCTSDVDFGDYVNVTVSPRPTTPTISGNNTICSGGSSILTSSALAGNLWSNGATSQSITITEAGNYTVKAISGTCTSAISDTFRVIVNQPTSSSIAQSICQGSSYQFGSLLINTSGIYYDTLANSLGCDSIVTLNLTVNPVSSYSFTQSICQGSSYQFGGLQRTQSGVYYDTLTNSLGCDSIVALNLTVISPSTPTISGDTAFCQGGFSRLTSSALTGNLWSTGDTTQFINVAQAGSYSVRVISGACTSASSAPFRVTNQGPAPIVVNFDTTSNRCLGARLQLTPSGTFAHYYWNTGERTRSIYTRLSGQFSVQVANLDSCFGLPSPPIFIAFDTNWCSVEIFRVGIDSITANVWADYYVWYLDGIELLSSNTLKTIPIQGDGIYTFRSVTTGRTSPLSNPIVITSSKKSLATTKFEVFPNPASDKVTVNTIGTGTIEILNNLGQVLITQPAIETNEINVSKLAMGVYTVKFNGVSQKLVVR